MNEREGESKTGLWRFATGERGHRVTIRERVRGKPVVLDSAKRRSEQTDITVRTPKGKLIPSMKEAAKSRARDKAAALRIGTLTEKVKRTQNTVESVFALFFNEGGLPDSYQARTHHKLSRDFWCTELGADEPWNMIPPAKIKAAIKRLAKTHPPTADKRIRNLRTVYRWVAAECDLDLRDPTRTFGRKDFAAIWQHHTTARPRYTKEEIELLAAHSADFGERFHLFALLLIDSGRRGVQVRHAMRSGLNCKLEPPPPKGFAPHGHILIAGVKGQKTRPIALTARQRQAVDQALATYLAPWEAQYKAGEIDDYPLLPGDRGGNRGQRPLTMEPVSDTAMRKMWADLEDYCEIEHAERRAFHGSRRSWSDKIYAALGLDVLTVAGGWNNSETPEQIYVNSEQYDHIERAREVLEGRS